VKEVAQPWELGGGDDGEHGGEGREALAEAGGVLEQGVGREDVGGDGFDVAEGEEAGGEERDAGGIGELAEGGGDGVEVDGEEGSVEEEAGVDGGEGEGVEGACCGEFAVEIVEDDAGDAGGEEAGEELEAEGKAREEGHEERDAHLDDEGPEGAVEDAGVEVGDAGEVEEKLVGGDA
jgi:hypothetical protein